MDSDDDYMLQALGRLQEATAADDESLIAVQPPVHTVEVDEHIGGLGELQIEEAQDYLEIPAEAPYALERISNRPEESQNAPNGIEVCIERLDEEHRAQYKLTESEIVELVTREEFDESGQLRFAIEFTDGRLQNVTHQTLLSLENGQTALLQYYSPPMAHPGKRKRSMDLDYSSQASGSSSDHMEVDDEDVISSMRRIRETTRTGRALRSREASTRQSSRRRSQPLEDDEEEEEEQVVEVHRSSRTLRARQPPRQTAQNNMTQAEDDRDELAEDPRLASDDDEFHVPIITSDVVGAKKQWGGSRPRRSLVRLPKARPRQKSPDSEIEFEAPRRSGRSTKTTSDMRDDAFDDDDDESFYVVEEKAPGVPKAISIREVFQPLRQDSAFALSHLDSCHTCGSSRERGQLIYCQGCTLSYHKNCLGYRSAREHLATKIGPDNFVLQCKFCIGLYRKKDKHAPRHDMCQACKTTGKACSAFSEKKTSRQEEKLREENEGIDPVTEVYPVLLFSTKLILFRCVKCHRGWHLDHLPIAANNTIGSDSGLERLKNYKIDWECNDCSKARNRINRLVAWRYTDSNTDSPSESSLTASADVDEDAKEYLVKWEHTSYAHCVWKPGAWVSGFGAAAMRSSFAKRDMQQSLLKEDEKEAIPDEFIMPDVLLNVKFKSSIPRPSTKEEELANIDEVSRIFVKFQGLAYDDVVWDSPPGPDSGEVYAAYTEAFYEYVEGKYFQSEPYYKIRQRIKEFKDSPFEEVDVQPAGLQRGKLMGYQLEGLNWLLENYHHGKNVVLADEMGLGKTVQVVSLVVSLVQDNPQTWPFLIVVPNATCPNWRREFKQWTPDLRVVTYHGGKQAQDLAYKYELFPDGTEHMKAHVVIMSYDSAQDPHTRLLFKSVHWTGLVVDEGQRLKNDQNLLYGALRSMKIPFRLLLTGTPLQNNKRELFNLIQFIDDKADAAKLDIEYEVLDKETLPKLHERIRPYFLRRTKAGVLKFLPPMAQIIVPVTMTVIQEKLSKSIMAKNPQLIKTMFSNDKMNKTERGSLNNILMQLRKCLCHPFVYSEAIEEHHHDQSVIQRNLVEASAKLILLELMLPRLKERGHRVLIFSQFLHQLDIIEDFLTALGFGYRRLDGTITSLEKQRRIDAFNAPDSEVFAFLLSTRAGGVGINLATADTVIIMDPDFNPHQDMQALSRAHRIGQKNKVLCFQLVTKDSVEERVMQIGRKKMALDHALIESMDDNDLGGDDLESILKHGAQALFDEDYQKSAIVYDATSVEKLLDRSQVEQTKTDEEGSAETQFTYARVWANDKSGFDDDLGIEDKAPEPINSSVWDRIIAEREEEARQEAEAKQEVLGRGGRRRNPQIDYKTNAVAAIEMEALGPESDESSDNFSGAESADDSDEDQVQGKDVQEATDEAAKLTNSDERKKAKKQSKDGLINPKHAKGAEAWKVATSAAGNASTVGSKGGPAVKASVSRLDKSGTVTNKPDLPSKAAAGQASHILKSNGKVTARSRPTGEPPSGNFQTYHHRTGVPLFSGIAISNPPNQIISTPGPQLSHYQHPGYPSVPSNGQRHGTNGTASGVSLSEAGLRVELDRIRRLPGRTQDEQLRKLQLIHHLNALSLQNGKQQR